MVQVQNICCCRKCGAVYTDFVESDFAYSGNRGGIEVVSLQTACKNGGHCEVSLMYFKESSLYDEIRSVLIRQQDKAQQEVI